MSCMSTATAFFMSSAITTSTLWPWYHTPNPKPNVPATTIPINFQWRTRGSITLRFRKRYHGVAVEMDGHKWSQMHSTMKTNEKKKHTHTLELANARRMCSMIQLKVVYVVKSTLRRANISMETMKARARFHKEPMNRVNESIGDHRRRCAVRNKAQDQWMDGQWTENNLYRKTKTARKKRNGHPPTID